MKREPFTDVHRALWLAAAAVLIAARFVLTPAAVARQEPCPAGNWLSWDGATFACVAPAAPVEVASSASGGAVAAKMVPQTSMPLDAGVVLPLSAGHVGVTAEHGTMTGYGAFIDKDFHPPQTMHLYAPEGAEIATLDPSGKLTVAPGKEDLALRTCLSVIRFR